MLTAHLSFPARLTVVLGVTQTLDWTSSYYLAAFHVFPKAHLGSNPIRSWKLLARAKSKGVDANKAGFFDLQSNVIPASYGEIIYTKTKPRIVLPMPSDSDLQEIGSDIEKFDDSRYEFYKSAFLYKSVEWAYEEEVRVVKNVRCPPTASGFREATYKNNAGTWRDINIGKRKLYCFSIPDGAIKEVFFGKNFAKNIDGKSVTQEKMKEIISDMKKKNLLLYKCEMSDKTWDLEKILIPNE